MKKQLLNFVETVESGAYVSYNVNFCNDTHLTDNTDKADLFNLIFKVKQALSHFIDEYDINENNDIKLIVQAVTSWHNYYNNITIMNTFTSRPTTYDPKSFYNKLVEIIEEESRTSKANRLEMYIKYDDNFISMSFLSEKVFKYIINVVNELVTHTLTDGSTVQNMKDLSEFFDQAISCWENAKKNHSVFQQLTM